MCLDTKNMHQHLFFTQTASNHLKWIPPGQLEDLDGQLEKLDIKLETGHF